MQVNTDLPESREIYFPRLGVKMTKAILKRILDGQLPIHFFRWSDVDQLRDLRDAGYLKVSFGPLERYRRTSATVTEITPPGRTAIQHFDREFGAQDPSECSP